MPEQVNFLQTCPYLGLAEDRDSHFSYPEIAHLCFATSREDIISLEHQAAFCLTPGHQACSRFGETPAEVLVTKPLIMDDQETLIGSLGRTVLWGLAGILIGLMMMLGIFYYYNSANNNSIVQQDTTNNQADSFIPPANAISIPMSTETIQEDNLSPESVAFLATPTPAPTARPGSRTYSLFSSPSDIGWLVSSEERGNHFGDSFLYAGILDGEIYTSGFQFDLSTIPRGAPIYHASIQLTGLRDDRLAVNNDQNGGVWMLRLLAPEIDKDWSRHNYQNIFNASALETLNPILGDQDLSAGKANLFELSPSQIKILETRIIEDEKPVISFRIDGPLVGLDNLFAWDTGYGPRSQNNRVILSLNVGEPPTTPPPFNYVIVTSTPTPENVVTAAAIVAQITAEATRIGTATPLPSNLATATPFPDYLVIVPTSTPENTATAEYLEIIATAEVKTTGTPTPIPTDAVTATPIPPTLTPTPTTAPTLTPTLSNYVLITVTPTPATVFEAATRAVEATRLFKQFGAPTPLPTHWVTPIVLTATPTPENRATAEVIKVLETAVALTTGTATPLPPNAVTATPTPIFDLLPLLLTPTPTGAPTATPQAVPSVLLGKILFRSDREWSELEKQVYASGACRQVGRIICGSGGDSFASEGMNRIYVYDLDTGALGRLTDDWPYLVARERNTYSADKIYRTYNKQLLWTNVEKELEDGSTYREPTTVFAIHFYDYKYKVERPVTELGAGWAWDPVWSPTSNQITFVSNDSADDEIWVINHDGTNAKQLTASNEAFNAREIGKDTFIPELNGFPTWSPDGQKIAFWSNRTGNRQLWIMNVDGSDQQLLMGWDNWTPYNDWDPVWVKYLDPAPPENQEQ